MKLENAKVTLTVEDPNELIEAMTEEEKLQFLQSLSSHDVVLDYVMQQVFEGCTEDGYSGSENCRWDGDTPLQKFRAKMIDVGASEGARRRVEQLERYMEQADKRVIELKEENYKMKDVLGWV